MVREDPTVIPYSASPGQAAKVSSGWRLEIAALLFHHLSYLWKNVVNGGVIGQESDLELRRIFATAFPAFFMGLSILHLSGSSVEALK